MKRYNVLETQQKVTVCSAKKAKLTNPDRRRFNGLQVESGTLNNIKANVLQWVNEVASSVSQWRLNQLVILYWFSVEQSYQNSQLLHCHSTAHAHHLLESTHVAFNKSTEVTSTPTVTNWNEYNETTNYKQNSFLFKTYTSSSTAWSK